MKNVNIPNASCLLVKCTTWLHSPKSRQKISPVSVSFISIEQYHSTGAHYFQLSDKFLFILSQYCWEKLHDLKYSVHTFNVWNNHTCSILSSKNNQRFCLYIIFTLSIDDYNQHIYKMLSLVHQQILFVFVESKL